MQVIPFGDDTTDGSGELALILEQSQVLSMVDNGGVRMHVLRYDNQDILAFAGPNNSGFVVYPCSSFDAEFDGSIHDQSRCLKG